MPIDYMTELDDNTERSQSRTLCESHGKLRKAIDDLNAIAYWYKYRASGLASDQSQAREQSQLAAQKTFVALIEVARAIQPEYAGWGGLEDQAPDQGHELNIGQVLSWTLRNMTDDIEGSDK